GNVQCERFALVVQALFINSGDLLRVAARSNFQGKLFRKQGAKLPSNGILPSHSEELLHARIPGLDDTFQIHSKNADIQRLHDVLAEVFEARDLESYSHVACNRFDQFDVIAGEIVAIDGLAEPQNGHGVFANAAGHKVIEVELLQSAAHGVTDVARGAGRLKKECPPRELGPGRAEETKIERLRETHAH